MMKNIILFAIVLTSLLASSCESFSLFEIGKDKDILEVDRDTLKFRPTEQRISFHITSGGPWRIVENPQPEHPFYTVSPESGNGDAWVMVTVYENMTIYHRLQEFLIKGEKVSKKLTIIQPAAPPSISMGSYYRIWSFAGNGPFSTVPANGGIVVFTGAQFGLTTIRCDCEDVTFDYSGPVSTIGFDYNATVPACPTEEGRTLGFFVTVTTESGELTQPYYVEQDGRAE
ncbi:MAG: BACON domain-containing protein [Bacteroidales bacterium]|nr:BACON domain-containing protein [Bacteroidales bacterium]